MTSIACATPEPGLFSPDGAGISSGSNPIGGIPNDVTLAGRGIELGAGGGTYAGGSDSSTGCAEAILHPHSSQNRDVSRFAVWQAGHLIIVFIARRFGPNELNIRHSSNVKYFTFSSALRKS
jgi:hypothetical protein